MINNYKSLLIMFCIVIHSLFAMENHKDGAPDNSFLNKVKELDIQNFRCPDDATNDSKPLLPLKKLKSIKGRELTPRHLTPKNKDEVLHGAIVVASKKAINPSKDKEKNLTELSTPTPTQTDTDTDFFSLLNKAIEVNATK